MNEIIGVLDAIVGLSILITMVVRSDMCHCPLLHKIGLWFIAMGMMYQSIRHLCPERFSDNVAMAFVHLFLWATLAVIALNYLKSRRFHSQP
jgi:hypothetical protein